jgi:hypothetical protein
MKKEGRLFADSEGTSNFSAPNFQTSMPLPVLLRGLSKLLIDLYEPEAFFARAFRSLAAWKTRPMQKAPSLPMSYNLRLLASSMWTQGVRSNYRAAYWAFLWRLVRTYVRNDTKLWMGSMILLSAHHFLIYAHQVANELEGECAALEVRTGSVGGDAVQAGRPSTRVGSTRAQ